MPIETVLERRALAWEAAWLLFLVLLPGCGAGTAAVISGSGDSGGGTTPALDLFALENPKVSPSQLRIDASQPVRVALFYDVGAGEKALTQLEGIAGNEVDLPAGEVRIDWYFATEPEIASTEYRPNARLVAKLGGSVIGGGELALGLGNDPPEIVSLDHVDIDPDENQATGTTGIQLKVSDSSEDVVSIRIEFDLQGDDPDAGWQLARPGLLEPGLSTPDFGVAGVQVVAVEDGGTMVPFFWATDAPTDLKDLERDVQLRFTAWDGFLESVPLVSSTFRVDNNEEPIVQLDSGPVISNPDERRGIPIPFQVIDAEEDFVEVILQWRLQDEEFPDLPTEDAALDAILSDPVLRRQNHICTEYPYAAQGRAIPVDATRMRLPELAAVESWILALGLEGRALDLLRPSSIPRAIARTWKSASLASPIAALPLADGLTALVLDLPGAGRLREIELATGEIVREIAMFGQGIPSAMVAEVVPGRDPFRPEAVLVALDSAGVWRIERVELSTGATTELAVSDGSQLGPVRGIASLGTSAAVFTAGSGLLSIDYRDPLAPRLRTLVAGLAVPWGVVPDPLSTNQVYLAEREALTPTGTGRVLAVALDSLAKRTVVVKTPDLQPASLERPTALALERNGSRMLIVTSGSGGAQLVGLDLGAEGRNISFPVGPVEASEIGSLVTGPNDLRLATLTTSSELLVGGGLEQRRHISAHEPVAHEVLLDAALDTEVRVGASWRIPAESILRASASGAGGVFVWSSGVDLPAGGRAFLRAVARDDELGLPAGGTASKHLTAALDVEPVVLGGPAVPDGPVALAVGDLDGDGDADVVSANRDGRDLTVFFQEAPGDFGRTLVLVGSGAARAPGSLAIGDVNGDGREDIVSGDTHDLTVYFQTQTPGTFTEPQVVGSSLGRCVAISDIDGDGDQDLVTGSFATIDVYFQETPGIFARAVIGSSFPSGPRPRSVAVGDLDGDGDRDIACTSKNTVVSSGNNSALMVFFQETPGTFGATPLVVASFPTVIDPASVAIADLDGDGDQDLVSDLAIFLQEAHGSFAPVPIILGASRASSIAVADLDGDGDQDLATANAAFFQEAPGRFARIPLVLGVGTDAPEAVVAEDLDGDGNLDIVSNSYNGDHLRVYFPSGRGSLKPTPTAIDATSGGFGRDYVAMGDLDGDGDQDLVSGPPTTLFFQETAEVFDARPLEAFGEFGAAVGDLDGDADLDLVSPDAFGDTVTVSLQESGGTFGVEPLGLTGAFVTPVFVGIGDLNCDGEQDMASANLGSNDLTVFFHGSTGFSQTSLGGPGITDEPISLALGDLDEDGDLDVVSMNRQSASLRIFHQDSSGVFAAAPVALGVVLGPSVAIGDLDGDGDLDLTSTNRGIFGGGSSLTVFFQDPPGAFATAPMTVGGPGLNDESACVTIGDLDGDGDEDLVSANGGNSLLGVGPNFTVFLQGAPGRFGPDPVVLESSLAFGHSMVIGDLDGDGDQDLVSANGKNLAVFWGGR